MRPRIEIVAASFQLADAVRKRQVTNLPPRIKESTMIPYTRRDFLAASAVGSAALTVATASDAAPVQPVQEKKAEPTRFQIACMTLPYSRFPLARALTGLRNAGYAHVAWGTTHMEDGKPVPVIARDAAVGRAKDLSS